MSRQLSIRSADGSLRVAPLETKALVLGRSDSTDLPYPNDTLLSRSHVVFEPEGNEWSVRDLGSTNGTQLNGNRITSPQTLRIGDKVNVGNLTILYLLVQQKLPAQENKPSNLEFTEDPLQLQGTVALTLDRVLALAQGPKSTKEFDPYAHDRMAALIEAGRELAAHRPLQEIFDLILRLSTKAVRAKRGVLMTFDGPELVVSAAIGAGFRISQAVKAKVLEERTSILVADTSMDEMLREARTIVEQRVKSLIAVPLQTESKVIGIIYVDSPDVIRQFTAEDLSLLTVMGNIAAVRIDHARLLEVERTEQIMAKELAQAAEIQTGLLPQEEPILDGLKVAGRSIPCRSVGGDYYDYFPLSNGRLVVLVGDVAGKGLPAALLMTSLQARVHSLVENYEDMAQLTTILNRGVSAKCPRGKFITFFIALLDPIAGTIAYCNAGHNPPILVSASGEVSNLEAGGPVLGVLGKYTYEGATVPWNPGDALIMFSDGISEAFNPAGEEYGEERLTELLPSITSGTPSVVLEKVFTEVMAFMAEAPASDDMTLVIATRN